MILKNDSTSARVYREFYGKEEMPQSLCPYFWKLVVAWPITLLFLPFTSITKLFSSIDSGPKTPLIVRAFIGCIVYVIFYVTFCIGVVISSYWITYYEPTGMYFNYLNGVVSLVLGCIFTIVFFLSKGIDRIRENIQIKKAKSRYDENGNWIPIEQRHKKPKQKSILHEFIYASYNKYCPKIDWE